jgi:hypothetical protein
MTSQQIAEAVAQMQRKTVKSEAWTVRQLPNGKWHHQYDAKREWADEAGCRTDYRFTCEHYANRGAL